MQRSASKATASSPSTPNGPPSKKMRLSSGHSAPGTPGTPDHVILQSALEAEEKKRQDALDKAAQHTGETKWVLSFKDPLEGKRKEALQVRHAGFAEIDADGDSEEDDEVQPIRKQFGGGVKRKEVRIMTTVQQSSADNAQKPVVFIKTEQSEGEADSSSEGSSGELDSDDPTAALIRETKREVAAEKRKKRDAQSRNGESSRGAHRSPKREASLHGLTSLSGGRGDRGAPKERDLSNVECFRCGQKGHLQGDCPKPRGSAGRGRGRGRR